MTELLLNNTRVVLPSNFLNKIVEKNPLLTKSGKYSLDITLSLGNKINARFFKNTHRFNAISNQPTTTALLIVNNKVNLKGTAAIVSKNSRSVTIQLLSGNSEINFLISDDMKMSAIDFGIAASPITKDEVVETFENYWPYGNYVCARNYSKGWIYNDIYGVYDPQTENIVWSEFENPSRNIQPFLLYYVQKIVEHLGYTIDGNALEADSLISRLIIFPEVNSYDYNQLIPDWTVSKFIDEVEKLGNVIFVVDKTLKKVNIVNRYNHYQTAPTNYIPETDVEFDYTAEVIEDKYSALNYGNLKYNLIDSEYWKYQALTEEVLAAAELETYANFAALQAAYPTNANRQTAYQTLKLFYVADTDNYYIVKGPSYFYFHRINIFRNRKDTSTTNESELNIVPVETHFGVPYSDKSNENTTEITDLNTIITEGKNTSDRGDKIIVGIFIGTNIGEPGTDYNNVRAQTINDAWKENDLNDFSERTYRDMFKLSLRFGGQYGLYNRLYANNINIDGANVYITRFKWKPTYDVRNYFVIRGRKFYCEQIESEGDTKENLVIGRFFAVN